VRYSRILFFVALAVVVLLVGCSQTDKQSNPIAQTDDPVINRMNGMLSKSIMEQADYDFISGLTIEDWQRIEAYYSAHPLSDSGTLIDTTGYKDYPTPIALAYSVETIEVQSNPGGRPNWIASGWFHTTACGGDASDHFYLYPGVPNAYNNRGALRVWSIHPGVWATLQYYQAVHGGMSARVYDNNNVYMCVGVAMHWFVVSHESWRTDCWLWMW